MSLFRASSDSNLGYKKMSQKMPLRRIASDINISNKNGDNSFLNPLKLILEPLYPKNGLSKFNHSKVGLQILASSEENQENPFPRDPQFSKRTGDIVLRMINIDMSAIYPFDSFLGTCFYCKEKLALEACRLYLYKDQSYCAKGCQGRALFADICAKPAAKKSKPKRSPKLKKGTIFFIPEA